MSLVPLLKRYGKLLALEGPPRREERAEQDHLSKQILSSEEWTRLADYVRKKWLLPADVGTEDIAQEMRLGLWKAFGDYKPGDYSFLSFARYRMHSAAYRFVQSVRKTKDAKDREGNFFPCISAVRAEDDERFVDADAWAAPENDPGRSRSEKEHLSTKLVRMDYPSAVAVLAFAHHESVDNAAESLAFDRIFRAETGLKKISDVRAFVRDAAERAAGWRGSVELDAAHG